MKITSAHRSVLGKRTANSNKIAMPLHCDLLEPWVLRAVIDLSAAGIIVNVATRIPMDHPRYGTFLCDIYQLTPSGEKLCADHDIFAAEAGS